MYRKGLHLHFIGIGGSGMSGIAEVLLGLGYSVSGSDLKASPVTARLQSLGASVVLGHSSSAIPINTSTVVVSTAVERDNVEYQEAVSRQIPIIPRAEMLAELMRLKYGIAIAGSHGKTTTTSLVGHLLQGFDPTVIVGGRVLSQGSGARVGKGQYLVAEADESDGSFVHLRPVIAVVTNIDEEHLSHFGSFENLKNAFREFLSLVPFYGLVVYCGDDKRLADVVRSVPRRSCSYGKGANNDFVLQDICIDGPTTTFKLSRGLLSDQGENCLGEAVSQSVSGTFELPVPGEHMALNCAASIIVGLELGVPIESMRTLLPSFPGVSRRSEVIGEAQGVLVIDDYGHHPREIAATLAAIRTGWLKRRASELGLAKEGELVVLFQPHRFSRISELMEEFIGSFSSASKVIISEIYAAGETAIPGIDGATLASKIDHPAVRFISEEGVASEQLARELSVGDVVVTMGAGSITRQAPRLLELLTCR